MIARRGTRVYADRFRRSVRHHIIRAMHFTPEEEQRAAAVRALRQLTQRLPWSVTSFPYPLLLLAIGPRHYRQLHSGYRRLRRSLKARVGCR